MNEFSPHRFFITDDDPGTISVLTQVLEFAGHTVSSTTSSVEAAELIKTMRPDCALIDIMMPQIDGLELCRQLRMAFNSEELKIIIVSAKPYEFDRKRAMKFGADGFLTKPIDAKTFENQVMEIVRDRLELKFGGSGERCRYPGQIH
jgi:DNA-binding response OmpR family regulator